MAIPSTTGQNKVKVHVKTATGSEGKKRQSIVVHYATQRQTDYDCSNDGWRSNLNRYEVQPLCAKHRQEGRKE